MRNCFEGKSPHCPAGWTYFDFTQKCYKYFGEKKKHADALKHCLEETGFSVVLKYFFY